MNTITIGRCGADVPLRVPDSGTWSDGDNLSISGTLGAEAGYSLADSIWLLGQINGLANMFEPVVACTFSATPSLDGFYRLGRVSVKTDGASWKTGAFDYSIDLERIAGSVVDSRLLHALRTDSAFSAGAAGALVGIPGGATRYRRAGVGLGGLTSLPVQKRDGTVGSVLVDTWADDDPQANAEWQVPPGGYHEGAAELLVGPALTVPAVLPQAAAVWKAEDWVSGTLEDLVGGFDGTPVTPTGSGTSSYPPVKCEYDGTKYLFLPGWSDEGLSSTRITQTGTLDVRWDCEQHAIDVNVTDYYPVHLGSDADELGFAAGFNRATGLMELRFSPDGSFVGQAYATAAPAGGTTGQRRILYNNVSGDVTFYERTSGDLSSDTGWTQVGAVVSTPGGVWFTHASQTLLVGGTSKFDGHGMSMGGFLKRMLVKVAGTTRADLNPSAATRPFATIAGGAGETWTFFRAAATSSYRADVIDRACVMLGNGARFDIGDVLDVGATDHLTVVHAFWHQVQTPAINGLIGKASLDGNPGDEPGWGLAMLDNPGGGAGTGGLLGLATDGSDVGLVLDAGTPSPAKGTVSVAALVIDRAAAEARLYLDGVLQDDASTSAVGDTTSANLLRIGAYAGVSQQAWIGSAVFQGVLTAAEIDLAGDELLAAGFPDDSSIDTQLEAYRALPGRHLPGDLDPNTGWCLTNGLIQVLPGEGLGFDAGSLYTRSFAATAWESPTVLQVFTTVGTPVDAQFSGLSLLRNALEATAIRLLIAEDSADGSFTVDLGLRRGSRLLTGLIEWNEEGGNVLGIGPAPAVAKSDITGGQRAASNDPDGNRYVLATAKSGFTSVTGGVYKATSDWSPFDFGFGVEIGGSGSSGIDTAAALSAQYAAVVGETCRIVNA